VLPEIPDAAATPLRIGEFTPVVEELELEAGVLKSAPPLPAPPYPAETPRPIVAGVPVGVTTSVPDAK